MNRMLLLVLLAMGASTVLGVAVGLLVRRIPHRFNDAILGCAAGIMLAAAVLGLLLPAFDTTKSGMLVALVGAFPGAGLISVLDRITPHLHHIAGVETEVHYNGRIGKTLLFVTAIALHKIPEGLASGVSFGTGNLGDVMTVAGAISLQNIPEATVIVAPLFTVGLRARRVLGISLAIAVISMLSVVLGFALVSVFAAALPFLLAAAGGAMLYVISDEMIPETHAHGFEKKGAFARHGNGWGRRLPDLKARINSPSITNPTALGRLVSLSSATKGVAFSCKGLPGTKGPSRPNGVMRSRLREATGTGTGNRSGRLAMLHHNVWTIWSFRPKYFSPTTWQFLGRG